MAVNLEGSAVLITGAAGGIGRAITRAFLEHGARVAALDVAEDGLDALAGSLEAAGHGGRYYTGRLDVADAKACEAAVAGAVERFGGLHVLINNAALGMGVIRPDHLVDLVQIEEIEPSVWDAFVGVNLSGPWYLTRYAVPRMKAQGFGRIIDVTTSFFTMLRGAFHPYGPVKAGFEALAAGHASELAGTGITVNVVVPGGPADTPMVPTESGFAREDLIDPAVMAYPMLWLCSRDADGVSGNRYVAAQWDTSLAPDAAAARCAAPIGWPDLARSPVWPGGRPGE